MSRPTTLTPAVQARIIQAVEAGMFLDRAAAYAGINDGTFRRWMEKGDPERAGDRPNLNAMPLKTLRKLAKHHGITIKPRTTKPELAEQLKEHGAESWDLYVNFRAAVIDAEARAEMRMVAQWQNAMPDDWRAAKDFLSRRHRTRWYEQRRTELTGAAGGPIQIGEVDINAQIEALLPLPAPIDPKDTE